MEQQRPAVLLLRNTPCWTTEYRPGLRNENLKVLAQKNLMMNEGWGAHGVGAHSGVRRAVRERSEPLQYLGNQKIMSVSLSFNLVPFFHSFIHWFIRKELLSTFKPDTRLSTEIQQ